MQTIEPVQYSLDEAQEEASKMSEMVGQNGERKDYNEAQTNLIESQTRERLQGREWGDVIPFAVNQLDIDQIAYKEKSSLGYRLEEKQRDLTRISKDLDRQKSDQGLLEEAEAGISNGGTTLSTRLYGDTLFLGLMDSCDDKADYELKSTIFDKLSEANDSKNVERPESISLSPEEVELLKRALPGVIENVKHHIPQLVDSIDQCNTQIDNLHKRETIAAELSQESQEKLKVALSVLDKIEESQGAPQYADQTASTDEQYRACLDRIAWRNNKLRERGSFSIPSGRADLGDKWAFYARINNEYLLLNKAGAWNSVRPLSIITNRTPGRTFALYAEGMYLDRDVSLMAVIDNGIVQDLSFDERKSFGQDLQNNVQKLKDQLDQ